MAIPVLKLNLAPPPTLWRQRHIAIGWAALIAGIMAFSGAVMATIVDYSQAAAAGQNVAALTSRRQAVSRKQASIRTELESIDVEKELPRWRLAERILSERGFPWSRLTAELERSLVQDVRIKNVQRTRDSAQHVQLKIKAEAHNRPAEDAFLESLRKNTFFAQTILEREAEIQGGLEFDLTLPVSDSPSPYTPLPKYGPASKKGPQSAAAPLKPVATQAPIKPNPAPLKPAANPAPPRPVVSPRPAPPMIARPTSAQPGPTNKAPIFNPGGNPAQQPRPISPGGNPMPYRPGMPPVRRQPPAPSDSQPPPSDSQPPPSDAQGGER